MFSTAQLVKLRATGNINLSGRDMSSFPVDVLKPAPLSEDEQWWAIAGLKRLDISNNERLTCDEPGWADLAAHAETFQGFVAHNNAIAQLPPALWDCAQLHTLAMSRNKLRALPGDIGRLENLVELDLSHNLLAELPSELRCCTKLAVVNVAHNRLEGRAGVLGSLPALQQLDASHNRLAALEPGFGPPMLRELDVSFNSLRELALDKCEQLSSIKARQNQLQRWPSFSPAGHVLVCILSNNASLGPGLPRGTLDADALLPALQHVTLLDVSGCRLQRLGGTAWAVLQDMHTLDVRFNDLPGLPSAVGWAPVSNLLVEGNPMRAQRKLEQLLRAGSTAAALGYLRDRATPEEAREIQAAVDAARRSTEASRESGSGAAAQPASAPSGPCASEVSTTYRGQLHGAPHEYDAIQDARTAQAERALDISHRGLSAWPAALTAAIQQASMQAGQAAHSHAHGGGGWWQSTPGDSAEVAPLCSIRALDISQNPLGDGASCLPLELAPLLSSCASIAAVQCRIRAPPLTLAALPALRVLDLSNNPLDASALGAALAGSSTGADIAAEASAMACDPTDELPFGALPRLAELTLINCGLDTLPPCLAAAHALQVLRVDQNRIADPACLPVLPALRQLHMAGNALARVPPAVLACPRLHTLDLSNNSIAQIEPRLACLATLAALHLEGNPTRELPHHVIARGAAAVLPALRQRLDPAHAASCQAAQQTLEAWLQARAAAAKAEAAQAAAARQENEALAGVAPKIGDARAALAPARRAGAGALLTAHDPVQPAPPRAYARGRSDLFR